MSPTGPNYPSSAVDSGGIGTAWSTPANAKVADGVYTTATVGGGGYSNSLITTGYGFNLPTYAIVDGIYVEFLRYGINVQTLSVQMMNNTTPVGTAKTGTDFWPTSSASVAWQGYGGPTDLWGATWTPATINSTNFGFEMSAFNTHGGSTFNVDAMRVTVYWHVTPTIVPHRYLYKIYSNTGTYLGNLPSVISDFNFSQEINQAGSQITIECATTADTSRQATSVYTDESGNTYTDEAGATNQTTEGAVPIVQPGSSGIGALIKNGNSIQVWEYSYYWPNGKCMFLGQIQRWEADFGGSAGSDTIRVLAYSDGSDLDNYIVRANPYTYTADQNQGSWNSTDTVSTAGLGAAYFSDGQSWTVGAGVTNLGAITIGLNGSATVTVNVYTGTWGGATLLGSSTQSVSVGGATGVQFAFTTPITVVPGTQYFFSVSVAAGQSIGVLYQNTSVYTGGNYYSFNSGGSGGNWVVNTGQDLLFTTYSGTGSTTGTFTSQDPTAGMLMTIMNDYIARGGKLNYSSSSIQTTNLSLTAQFQVQTVLEAMQTILTLCPAGYFWYVDLGTDTLYCKQTDTATDFVLTKGKHIDQITFVSTIENIKNTAYFTGGTVSGSNIYVESVNAMSIGLYGPRLDRPSNSAVIDNNTARTAAAADVLQNMNEQYQTTVTVLYKTADITLFKPGMTVGFNGFGTFVDNVITQIVRMEYKSDEVLLTLGILPKRLHPAFDKVIRGIIALQTIANPSTPS